jgi:hypothetical protein
MEDVMAPPERTKHPGILKALKDVQDNLDEYDKLAPQAGTDNKTSMLFAQIAQMPGRDKFQLQMNEYLVQGIAEVAEMTVRLNWAIQNLKAAIELVVKEMPAPGPSRAPDPLFDTRH